MKHPRKNRRHLVPCEMNSKVLNISETLLGRSMSHPCDWAEASLRNVKAVYSSWANDTVTYWDLLWSRVGSATIFWSGHLFPRYHDLIHGPCLPMSLLKQTTKAQSKHPANVLQIFLDNDLDQVNHLESSPPKIPVCLSSPEQTSRGKERMVLRVVATGVVRLICQAALQVGSPWRSKMVHSAHWKRMFAGKLWTVDRYWMILIGHYGHCFTTSIAHDLNFLNVQTSPFTPKTSSDCKSPRGSQNIS